MKKFTCKVCALGVTITGQQTVSAWARQLGIDPKSVDRHIAHGDRNGATKAAPAEMVEESSDGSRSVIAAIRDRPVTLQDARDWITSSGDNPDDYKLSIRAIAYGADLFSNRMSATPDLARKAKAEAEAARLYLPALYAEAARTRIKPHPPRTGKSTTVVVFADPQVGKRDSRGGTPELIARLAVTRAKLAAYIEAGDSANYVLADVGDGTESFENVASQAHLNDLSFPDQVDMYATERWKFETLMARYGPVDSLAVPSNHGAWRAGKNVLGKPTDDWGIHVHRRLAERAADTGQPITHHFPEEWNESLTFT